MLLEGRVVRSESDDKKTKFTVATNESYKDKSGATKEITDYHNCIIWKPINLEKGQKISVEGKLKTTKYNDKYYTNVVVWSENQIKTGINERSDDFSEEPNKYKDTEENDNDVPF